MNICSLCDVNILNMDKDNYDHPLEVVAKCAPPPGKPGTDYYDRTSELFLGMLPIISWFTVSTHTVLSRSTYLQQRWGNGMLW